MIESIRELFAYHRWANGRVLDAVAALEPHALTKDLGSSFPSVLDTLVHMLVADWAWLSRWHGTSPTAMPPDWNVSNFEALRARWSEIEAEQQAFVAALAEEDLRRPIAYRNTKGDPFVNTLDQMLRHVVNHASYHRGQVTTLLRQLGAEPVSTDLIGFYRQFASEGPQDPPAS